MYAKNYWVQLFADCCCSETPVVPNVWKTKELLMGKFSIGILEDKIKRTFGMNEGDEEIVYYTYT